MQGIKNKIFTVLLVEDNGGDVEMFLRTVEDECRGGKTKTLSW